MTDNLVDVAIIGGGPAGLQAALVLARTRKKIVVFDDPRPARNSASHGVHNLLGLDGLLPQEIRAQAWKQIAVYHSATLDPTPVTSIQLAADGHFWVHREQGQAVRAKHVILAVGYRDIYPSIPGFADCWAKTIIPCPYCDGYENRDRVWGVVAASARDAQHFPKLALNWTSQVKLLLQPGVRLGADDQNALSAAGIAVHLGQVIQVHHRAGEVEAVALDTGEQVAVGTLLWVPAQEPLPLVRSLVEQLGLAVDDEGYVITNAAQQTNVPGLWAVGDVQHGRWALDALSTGGKAAQMMIKAWYA